MITDNRVDYASGIELLSMSSGAPVPTSAHLRVTNSVIARNQGGGSAAIFAIRFSGECLLELINSTVTGNEGRAPHGEDAEGAIVLNEATANITNTILWGNVVVPSDPGADLDVGADAVANVGYSDVGASKGVFGGVVNDLGANVSVDPQLSGFALAGTSPLIDAGTCTGAPSEDIDGDPRPSGAGCDIGADELVP